MENAVLCMHYAGIHRRSETWLLQLGVRFTRSWMLSLIHDQILLYPPDILFSDPLSRPRLPGLVDVVHRACGGLRAVPRRWWSRTWPEGGPPPRHGAGGGTSDSQARPPGRRPGGLSKVAYSLAYSNPSF